jgi:hypothetical protein
MLDRKCLQPDYQPDLQLNGDAHPVRVTPPNPKAPSKFYAHVVIIANDSMFRGVSQSKATCALRHGHSCSEFVWLDLDIAWNEVRLLGAFAPVESEVGLVLTKTKSALSQQCRASLVRSEELTR